MSHRRNRYALWAAFAVLLGMGLTYAFWPRPVLVDVARVRKGTMQVTIEEDGEARIHDVYVVSAPVASDMARIEIEVGDEVRAGETKIAALRPINPAFLDRRSEAERKATVDAAQAAVDLASAEVERAEAELEFAEADLARARSLKVGDSISARALQRSEIEVKTRSAARAAANATLEVKRSELAAARASLIAPGSAEGGVRQSCCIELTAPVSGKVLRVMRQSEGVVAAGDPLVEIGNSDDLEVVADLLSTDAVQVREGAPVMIIGWGEAQIFAGRVRRVEPYGFTKVSALGIEEQRVNVLIDFDDKAAALSRLGHGFRVEVQIETWRGENVLQAPLSALFRDGETWAVFVIENRHARLRKIEAGHRNTKSTEILVGLEAGDMLILYPSDTIEEGSYAAPRVPLPKSPAAPSTPQPQASHALGDATNAIAIDDSR